MLPTARDSPDSPEPLVETAVRPLSDDAEVRTAAVSLLETLIAGPSDEAATALARWNAVDGEKHRSPWKILLSALFGLVSAVMLTDAIRTLLHYEDGISMMDGAQFLDFFHDSPHLTDEDIARDLSPAKRWLVFGDLSQATPDLRMKALRDSEPDNPAYFAEYANAYLAEHRNLPPDFLKTARRIDPRNAWFTYVAAGIRAKDAVKMRPQTKADQAANAPPEWEVLDRVALDDALAMLREARAQPECETYRNELLRA